MRIAGVALGLLVLLGLVLWLAGGDRSARGAVDSVGPQSLEPKTAAAEAAPEPEAVERAPAPEREAEEPAERAADAEEPEEVPEDVDRDERRELVIRVVTTLGDSIHSAKVRATGTRTVQNPGDWLGWRGATLAVETDVEGVAVIDYPVFFHSSGGSWRDTSTVCFTVRHPDYVAQNLEAKVAEGEYRVELERGTLVLVSGWIESPSERVEDLSVRVSDDVRLGSGAWERTQDGRMSCSSMPPGTHALLVEHERDGVLWHSDPEPFTVGEGDQLELELELLPPRRITGALDAAVPRPVVDGGVTLHVYREDEKAGWILSRSFEAPVAEDGSFALEGVRRGPAEIIGICEGWSSTAGGEDRDEPQEIPEELEGELTLAMQPTATLEVEVEGPDGAPLSGAPVYTWPNVRWRIGYSTIFMGRRWQAATDARGVARIANLPPGEGESLVVIADGLQMPMGESPWGIERRNAWADYVSGETARVEVRMEAAED